MRKRCEGWVKDNDGGGVRERRAKALYGGNSWEQFRGTHSLSAPGVSSKSAKKRNLDQTEQLKLRGIAFSMLASGVVSHYFLYSPQHKEGSFSRRSRDGPSLLFEIFNSKAARCSLLILFFYHKHSKGNYSRPDIDWQQPRITGASLLINGRLIWDQSIFKNGRIIHGFI